MAKSQEFDDEPRPQQQDSDETERNLHSERQHADDPQEEERDPNIVDWDGPDDPANPQNWYVKREAWPNLLLRVKIDES